MQSAVHIANILMKVNTKMNGGLNGVISGPLSRVSASRTIIFGADVTHLSLMDKTRPSIAVVTAQWIRTLSVTHRQFARKIIT